MLAEYIAGQIKACLVWNDPLQLLAGVGPVRWDVSKTGDLASQKKTIDLLDHTGKRYRITVDEV